MKWSYNEGQCGIGTGSDTVRKMCWTFIPSLDPDFEIRDAITEYLIEVRRRDFITVDKQQKNCPYNCPISVAALRQGKPALILTTVAYFRENENLIVKRACPPDIGDLLKAHDHPDLSVRFPGVQLLFTPPKGNKRVGGRIGESHDTSSPGRRLTKEDIEKRRAADSRRHYIEEAMREGLHWGEYLAS